ncbi:sigma-70 family RNA polymerase sigma factor [Delftia acidovorans]|uniref:sigma-70 family RNA polymerase sigma factor n=1 Tax=Delftia acidovorans TaxID=80866 RepID=UPI00333F5020
MVLDYMNLVHYVVSRKLKISQSHQDYEDLVQVGMVGLIRAAEQFDASRGFKFTTYAVPKIFGEVQRYRRDNRLVKIPRTWSEVAYTVRRRGLEELAAGEIAAALDCNIKLATGAINTIQLQILSTNASISLKDDEKVEFENLLGEQDDLSRSVVNEFMSYLDECELAVVTLRLKGLSQSEIAVKVGCKQPHVSRVLRRIANKYTQWAAA